MWGWRGVGGRRAGAGGWGEKRAVSAVRAGWGLAGVGVEVLVEVVVWVCVVGVGWGWSVGWSGRFWWVGGRSVGRCLWVVGGRSVGGRSVDHG